jgi:rubrerythrin
MTLNVDARKNGASITTLELLLHVLAHEVESQAYLQMAIRAAEDADMKAFLIAILGQEQMHETLLRSKLREKFNLEV